MTKFRFPLLAGMIAVMAILGGCSGETPGAPVGKDERRIQRLTGDGKAFGDLTFGGDSETEADAGGTGIGVNSFLWRASLDTISFFPLSQADPFGGVIITDWYSPPEAPDTRFKLNVFILGRQLRADGVRVNIFKQQRSPTGAWVDTAVSNDTVVSLENAILTRARELRVATLSQPG